MTDLLCYFDFVRSGVTGGVMGKNIYRDGWMYEGMDKWMDR